MLYSEDFVAKPRSNRCTFLNGIRSSSVVPCNYWVTTVNSWDCSATFVFVTSKWFGYLNTRIQSINVVVTFKSVDETLACNHSNESYNEQSFHVVLFIMLSKVVVTFRSVDETLVCDHSNESY